MKKYKQAKEMGVDLKKMERWMNKNIIHKDHYFKPYKGKCYYVGDCMACRAWRIYEELQDFIEFIQMLDKIK